MFLKVGNPKAALHEPGLRVFSNHILTGDGFLGEPSIGFKTGRDRLLQIGPSWFASCALGVGAGSFDMPACVG